MRYTVTKTTKSILNVTYDVAGPNLSYRDSDITNSDEIWSSPQTPYPGDMVFGRKTAEALK